MAYNYNNFGYNPQYNRQYPQMSIQQPIPQVQQQVINPVDLPISEIRYANEADSNTYLVDIGRKIMFIDRNAKVCTIKWSDSLGNSGMKKFKFDDYDEPQNAPIDTSNFLTKNDISIFAKQDDFNAILERISNLEKKIKINDILEEK